MAVKWPFILTVKYFYQEALVKTNSITYHPILPMYHGIDFVTH